MGRQKKSPQTSTPKGTKSPTRLYMDLIRPFRGVWVGGGFFRGGLVNHVKLEFQVVSRAFQP